MYGGGSGPPDLRHERREPPQPAEAAVGNQAPPRERSGGTVQQQVEMAGLAKCEH
jgi:hypothetical protein